MDELSPAGPVTGGMSTAAATGLRRGAVPTTMAQPLAVALRRVTLGGQIGYGIGQIAGQVFRDLPSLLLLFFMTTVLGIAPALAGVAIFVPKLVVGVVCDFAVGALSDRWRRRIARRWWLIAGACGAPVALIALFHVPAVSSYGQVAYVAAVFSGYMIVFASFSVPYLAIAGELTTAPEQRSVLMAWRLVFTAAGVLIQGALAPAIVQARGGGQPGYEAMSVALAVICPVALMVAFVSIGKGTYDAGSSAAAPRARLTLRQALAVLVRPRFSVLLLANLLQLAGAGMGYASMLYFLTYNMARHDAFALIGGLVLAACAGIVVSQPLWVRLGVTIGKKRAYILGSAIYALSYTVWAFAAHWGTAAAYVLSFVAAVGNAGWTMLGFSMMSDVSGEDDGHAGLYSAAWVAADKVGFALGGTLLVGLVLSGFGFDSARAVAGLPQTSLALTGVMVAFGLTPAALNALGGAILAFWGRQVDA